MFRRNLIIALFALGIITLAFSIPLLAEKKGKKPKLEPKYKKWLEEEVVWIVSKTEREVFLNLQTDAERDRFIQSFWDARDPTPGTPTNEFKEEHYRRIEYANSHFNMEGGPGWQTDRGRMYIQLGPPAQIFDWLNEYQLYPLELWFYSPRDHRSLPNNFYLIFWEREGAGPFKLYSPYNDTPEKLVHAAQISGLQQSYQYLRSVNGELARATISYLPGEPIDISTLSPSMTSDLLMDQIFNLRNVEGPTDYLNVFLPSKIKLGEKVQTRYSFQFQQMVAVVFPVVSEKGGAFLQYMFEITPKDLSVVRYKDQYYVSLDVTISVSDLQDHVLFQDRSDFIKYFPETEFKIAQAQPLVVKDRIAIVPGKYKVDIIVYNRSNSQTYQYDKTVEIPEVPSTNPAISPLVLVDKFSQIQSASPDQGDRCFTFFGYRFDPMLEKFLRPVENLNVLFQLFYPPEAARKNPQENLTIEYALVQGKNPAPAKTITDQVSKSKFNSFGNILNFKQLPLAELVSGHYALIVTVKEPSGQPIAGANTTFSLDPLSRRSTANIQSAGQPLLDEAGLFDFQRAMLLAKLGEKALSAKLLTQAVAKSPNLTRAALELAKMELDKNNAGRTVELLERVKTNADFPLEGKILLSEAYVTAGRKTEALAALDKLAQMEQLSRRQYLQLSELYRRLDNQSKAAEMVQKAGPEGESK